MIKVIAHLLPLFTLCYAIHPGPVVTATKGEVWPQVQNEVKSPQFYSIKPDLFKIITDFTAVNCPNFIDDIFKRYWLIISTSGSLDRRGRVRESSTKSTKKFADDANYLGNLASLEVKIEQCENEDIRPRLGDDEKYSLKINDNGAILEASSIWGTLRGLETFSQLVYYENDELLLNGTSITDYPRFTHRGFMLDTARHFMPMYIIYEMLDAMAFNKFNVFHWHLVDDHSFPLKSRTFPELSDKGAYHPVSKVYEQSDVLKVIEYARVRGIRVVPEVDTPGHTSSWGVSHPELLTTCFENDQATPNLGPLDPSQDSTYDFIKRLFSEIDLLFHDEYFHIGGDEVDMDCWKSNKNISDFMTAKNISTYKALETYFIQHGIDYLTSLKTHPIVWEEVFDNGAILPNDTIVNVWIGDDGRDVLKAVTDAGHWAIHSSGFYLDHVASGTDWEKFYERDFTDFPGTVEQKRLILGGEACMWAEVVNEFNVIPRVWPRASAVAERLWTDVGATVTENVKMRLEEHTCRMNRRGIGAQPPNGPGVCL